MTKEKKHEHQIKTDGTYTMLTVYDLNGNKHVFPIDNLYRISIVNSYRRYWLEYSGSDIMYTQAVPINESQFNMLKDIIKGHKPHD